MEKSGTVCAVVVTYNRKVLLAECLDALLAQICPLSRIFVVDNASSDGTEQYLKEKGYLAKPVIVYTRLTENLGGAGGFYHGMKRAYESESNWIWVMDDDSEPRHDTLEIMKSFITDAPDLGMVVPKIIDKEGHIDCTARGILRFNDSFKTMFRSELKDSDHMSGAGISFASFVGPLVSRQLVSKVGLPNPDFFIYHDDVDYSIRAYKDGYRMLFVPNSVVVHKEGRYFGDMRKGKCLWMISTMYRLKIKDYWRAYYATRNQIYLCKKYQDNKIYFYLEFMTGITRIIGGILLYDDMKIERIKLVIRACLDGFAGVLGKKIDPAEWRKRFETLKI